MRLTKALSLVICLSLTTSCATTFVCTQIPVPERGELIPVTQEMWDSMSLESRRMLNLNGLTRDEFEDRLEGRIVAHNLSCE